MAFNSMEKEVISLCESENIDVNRINELLKSGANVNASNDVIEDDYNGSLLSECIFASLSHSANLYDLLKCFLNNNLDLEKYGSSIIGDLHAAFQNNDVMLLVKTILDNSKVKLNVKHAITLYKMEAEYLSDDFNIYDNDANIIDSVSYMLEEYESGNDYNSVYNYTKIIGQKVLDVTTDNTVNKSTSNYILADTKNKVLNTLIKCETDLLCISNSTTCYVNNNTNFIRIENPFLNKLRNDLIGQTITKIEFEHTFDRLSLANFKSSRNVKIFFSNNKELFYKNLTPGTLAIRLIDLNDKQILNNYKDVFLEQVENFLDSSYSVIPDMSGRYKICHNCNMNSLKRMSFVFEENDIEKEYISIDEDSLTILYPYFEKHIVNFNNTEDYCIATVENILDLKKDIERLISKLEKEEYTDEEYIKCVENSRYFTEKDYDVNDIMELRDFNFPYYRDSIIEFLKAFVWYFNEYKKFNELGDNRKLRIYIYK